MFAADQHHIHHRLLALGFSHRNAVLLLYALALGLSGLAFLSVLAQYRNSGVILLAVGLATYIGVQKLGYDEITFLRTGTLLRWYEEVRFNRLFFLGFDGGLLL
jgi:UDP-GlcNAc:undecaprenyl-phosphate GlcNAc-1-phosphate transferase